MSPISGGPRVLNKPLFARQVQASAVSAVNSAQSANQELGPSASGRRVRYLVGRDRAMWSTAEISVAQRAHARTGGLLVSF